MRLAIVFVALQIAGCASGVPVTDQTVVAGERFANVHGEARLIVRAFVAEAENTQREVVGARCGLESSLFSAEFRTPTRLVVPNFGPQSPELSVSCRAGNLQGTGRVAIRTRWQYPPGYGGFPYAYPLGRPYGVLGFGGWGTGAFPVSYYPDLHVSLH